MLKTHSLNNVEEHTYAASLTDTTELNNVSSGGVFWALAQQTIEKGGVVYGVEQPTLFDVHHSRAETIEQCEPFRRSKYLESNTGTTYTNTKKDLLIGRKVLYTGTGCQIAGLLSFLAKTDIENLVTCEVVCHGVPSMTIFRAYIKELERIKGKKVQGIIYRDKNRGWNKNCIRICFSDGTSDVDLSSVTPIHRGYLSGFYNRPSCTQCKYARLPRVADITLADYWNYKGTSLINRKKEGISLVVCSTTSGIDFFNTVKHRLLLDPSTITDASESCRHLTHSPSVSRYRKAFFNTFKRNGFFYAYNKYIKKRCIFLLILKLLTVFRVHIGQHFQRRRKML